MSNAPEKKAEKIKHIRIPIQRKRVDMSTILGLIIAMALIGTALSLGGTPSAFFDFRSFLIVFCGTLAVTSISFTGAEFFNTLKIIGKSVVRQIYDHKKMSHQMIDLAVAVRHDGVFSLQQIDKELKKDTFLHRGVQMIADGNTCDEVSTILGQEIDSQAARHDKGVSILRRAAETAPAMGLIGTLIGLVQMLAMLDDPSTIGPSMAIALLTTFYGAMLGTVVCTPLAGKLEANAEQEILHKTLILTTLGSIARQENPRRLEMMLNSELPPTNRVAYFK